MVKIADLAQRIVFVRRDNAVRTTLVRSPRRTVETASAILHKVKTAEPAQQIALALLDNNVNKIVVKSATLVETVCAKRLLAKTAELAPQTVPVQRVWLVATTLVWL